MQNENGNNNENMNMETVFAYTRADAIADGVLIDVTQDAKRFGFKLHTAFTSALLDRIITQYAQRYERDSSSEDVQREAISGALVRLFRAIKAKAAIDPHFDDMAGEPADRLNLDFLGIEKHRPIKAWAMVHPGDNMEPVLTVMLEGED